MKREKLIIYFGVMASIGLATYIVFSKKDDGAKGGSPDVTPQSKPDLKTDVKIREGKTIGLNIQTKVADVKLRRTAVVDDGWADNLYGNIPVVGTLIGKVITDPVTDLGGAWNSNTKQPYKWVGVEITDAVYDEIQKNQRNFLTRDTWKNKPKQLYVREDVIKLV